MSDERKEPGNPVSDEAAARRDFLKKSGRIAAAAPAAVLLLSVAGKSSAVNLDPYQTPPINPPE